MLGKILAAGCLIAGLGFSAIAGELNINIKDAGAAGDGITDDSQVIQEAVAKINNNKSGSLIFPKGTYLYKSSGNGMTFNGVSDVTVRFAKDAVLLMDNLKNDGRGNGHGILFKQPGNNINLEQVTIKWKTKPKHRSNGDGIRFDGYPSTNKTISNILMSDCRVINSPQTGAIFQGCANVTVKNFKPEHTNADGLHFNACQKVNVQGVSGINNGDDTLAFVTYYHPTKVGVYREPKPPFNQPALGDWNNTDSTAQNITAVGGHANGVRVSGGKNISITNVSVDGKGFSGIQIDAAQQTTENRAVGWSYLASQNIKIDNIKITNCTIGFVVRTLNILPDETEARWKHSIAISNLEISKCRSGIDLLDSGDISMNRIKSDSQINLRSARGKYLLNNVQLNGAGMYINGTQGKEFQGWRKNREPKTFLAVKDLSNLVDKEIIINNLEITAGMLRISDCAGANINNIFINNSPKHALGIYKSKNCSLNNIMIDSENVSLHTSNINNVKIENCIYGPQKRFMLAGANEKKALLLKNVTMKN